MLSSVGHARDSLELGNLLDQPLGLKRLSLLGTSNERLLEMVLVTEKCDMDGRTGGQDELEEGDAGRVSFDHPQISSRAGPG